MKILFSLLIAGLISYPLQAQFMLVSSPADSLRKQGDLKGAIIEYRKLYEKNPGDVTNLYNFACALSLSRRIDSAFKYLYLSTKLDTAVDALLDPDFLPLREDSDWTQFEQNLIAAIELKNNFKYQDLPYAQKLWKMGALDQAYYYDMDIAEQKTGKQSSVIWAIWDLKHRINDENQRELEELIKTKGWPLQSQVGGRAANVAFLVIQHSTTEKQKRFLPTIEDLCKRGEASWQSYALMYDRIQTAENKPQKYGSQINYNSQTDKYELFPLLDAKMVDTWRKEVGLGPLAEYVSRWNIKPEEIK